MNKPVYFIAVNYNNAAYSLLYVKSVLSLKSELPVKIIIVDNKSEEEDLNTLHNGIKQYDNVILVRNNENSGYFRGLNKGIEAINDEAGFVIIGNNDLTFDPDFLQNLSAVKYDDTVMALAPDVVTANGIHQNPLCADRMSPLRKWGLRIYYLNYYFGRSIYHITQAIKRATIPNRKLETSRNIYMGIGAIYILTPVFFITHKKLREDVFLWSEEALFAGQIHESGGKMLYIPQLIVHHAENTSIKKIPSRMTYEIARTSFLKTFKYY